MAAAASFLDARAAGGRWLLRMEDLDPPREVPGAADAILQALEDFGFAWDEPVLYQSQRQDAYRDALETLSRAGAVFACGCSRKELAAAGVPASDGGWRYPGTCRNGLAPGREARALRLRVDDAPIRFVDRCQGPVEMRLESDCGDFVLSRADGLISYQLAVVVDDAFQRITDVVRGADLLSSTPRQMLLQLRLGLATPRYLHVPVAESSPGVKLSKQTFAPALDAGTRQQALWQALAFLGQAPPAELAAETVDTQWQWAIAHWRPEAIPSQRGLPAPVTEASARWNTPARRG